MSGRRFRWAVPIGLLASLASAPALADVTKDQCIDANGKGQELRREGKLTAAREQLRACANPSCPAMVRDDCTRRLDELDKSQPTIAFEVKDASGADLVDVKVSMDGQPLLDHLDGSSVNVNPGVHAFTFEMAGQPPVTRKLVVTEGEKGRRERITIGVATASTPASAPPMAPSPPPVPVPDASGPTRTTPVSSAIEPAATGGMGTQKILGLVAGGVGLAGIGVGSVFGLMTLSQKSQQQSACASPTSCTSSGHAQALDDHSTGMTDSTISTVGFIAGAALLAGGAVLFFTAAHASQAPATGTLVVPSFGPGGAGMLFTGGF